MAKSPPDSVVTAIYSHGKKGREALERGDIGAAEADFIAAWNQLPEPKAQYDLSQSLSVGIISFYRDTKQFDKAKRWFDTLRAAYGPGVNDYAEFLIGTVYFDAGDVDRAFEIFHDQYKRLKQAPFAGEDKRYLQFYKKRAKVR